MAKTFMTNHYSVLVAGASGQLGLSLQEVAQDFPLLDIQFVGRGEVDLSQPTAINAFFKQTQFDVIINAAAYTAVDKAELEADLADAVNHLAVKQLAECAKASGALLVHVSTDYVFDGDRSTPYNEEDIKQPKNVYGLTKLKGEQAIIATAPSAIIVRTSWLYSEFGHNFVKTMLHYGKERDQLNVVYDQVGTPTYAGDLALALLTMVSQTLSQEEHKAESVRVYHYSNEGVSSWYDLAHAVFDIAKINCKVLPIETKDYVTAAQRPNYSLLNKKKIKHDFDLTIPYWRDSLQRCITKITN